MKVQCESCRAEYNIDEERVPSEGLQIKCPKCSSTFLVTRGGIAPQTAGDLFDLGNVDLSAGGEDSLELDLPGAVESPGIPPPRAAPPADGGWTLPQIGGQAPSGPGSSLPEIPRPGGSPAPTPGSEGQIFDFIDHEIAEEQLSESGKTTRYRIRRKSGKVFGPFDAETVIKMLAEHQLMGNEEASTDGHSFKPLGAFEEFSETIRLLMDEPVVSSTPTGGPPPSSVEAVDDDDPLATIAPKGVEFAEPAEVKQKSGPGAATFVLVGMLLLLVLLGVGLGFTPYGFFGYNLITGNMGSSGTGSGGETGGIDTSGDPPVTGDAAGRERQWFYQDTFAGYDRIIRTLEKKVEEAEQDELYLLGLTYAAMLRNYGADERYLGHGRRVLARMKDEEPDSAETRKVEAAFAILTNATHAQVLLTPLTGKDTRDKEALFLAGWAMAYQKNWRKAAEFFDRATVIDPDYAKAYHALGDIQSLQGDFDNAMSFYAKALEKNPEHLHSAVEQARIFVEVKDLADDGEVALKDVFGKNFQKMAPSERAKAHMLRAGIAMRRHDNDKALMDLNAAIQLVPKRVAYLAALGEFHLDVGEYAKAQAMFAKALELEPNNVDALVGHGRAMWQNGDIVKAKMHLEKTAAKAKGDPRPLYLLGRIAEDLDRPDEAMALYQRAAKEAPGFLKSRVAMARLQLKLGHMKKALEELTNARKASPRSAIVRNGLGEIYLKQGNMRLAKTEFDEALRLDPELPSAHFNLGNVLRELKKYSAAIEAYKKTAVFSPRFPNLAYEHGYAMYLKGDHAEALKMYEEAIRNNPKDDRLYVRAGLAAEAAGDRDAAIQYFQSATGLDSTNRDAYFQLGVVFERQRNYEGALELFKQVVEINAKDSDTRYHMGLCYLNLEMAMDAIDEFRSAVELDPNNVDAAVELGKALSARLQFAEAIQHFNRVARKQPKRVDVLVALGDAYHKQGELKRALKIYQRAFAKAPRTQGLAYRLGRIFDDLEKRTKAVKFYLRAVKVDSKDPMPHYYLGHVYKSRGANRKALAEFKRYLHLRPDAPDSEDVREEIDYLKNE